MGTKAQTGINRTDKSGLVFCRVLNGYNCRVLVAMIPQKSIESVLYRVLAGKKSIRRVKYENVYFLVLYHKPKKCMGKSEEVRVIPQATVGALCRTKKQTCGV